MGDYVKEGQVLFTLRKGTLGDSVVQSRANLEAARVRLNAAEVDFERRKSTREVAIPANVPALVADPPQA